MVAPYLKIEILAMHTGLIGPVEQYRVKILEEGNCNVYDIC